MKRLILSSSMKKYTFKDGTVMTSRLDQAELLKRINRLDTLRVLTEPHDCPEGRSICRKALNAYDKLTDFTGIVRLTSKEKDWLGYMLENKFLSNRDIDCIKFYTGIRQEENYEKMDTCCNRT